MATNFQDEINNGIAIVTTLIEIFDCPAAPYITMIKDGAQTAYNISDKLFWTKFQKFITGVYTDEESRLKFLAKLTERGKKESNALRIIETINNCSDLEKMDCIINLTRAYFTDFITKADYFRLCKIINVCILEDLLYIRDNLFEEKLKYSDCLEVLLSQGLVRQKSIDQEGNQTYCFTHLAFMLDKYSISYNDVKRYPDPSVPITLEDPKVDVKAVAVWG